MHNWRLLLLALIAVLQPIAPFTERNLIDGRQERCHSRPHSLLRDSRPSLHGTYRLSKTIPEERRSGHRDIREDRSYESRQQNSVLASPSKERSLLERSVRRISPKQTASLRADGYRERVSLQARERNVRDIRAIKRNDYNRIIDERFASDSLMRQNDRDTLEPTRSRMSRADSKPTRLSTKRVSRNSIDSRRETQRMETSRQLKALSRTRETMDLFERTRSVVAHSRKDNRRNIRDESRERTARGQESSFRLQTEAQIEDYRERRSLDRRTRKIVSDHRRVLSADATINDRVRNIRQEMRMNSRQDPEDRQSSRQTLVTARLDERKQQPGENRASRERIISVRRESRERKSTERRFDARESANRVVEINAQHEMAARNLITKGNDERYSRVYREHRIAVTVESRGIMRKELYGSRNRGLDRRTRVVDRMAFRDTRSASLSRSKEEISARDVSRIRVESGTIRDKNIKREAVDSHHRRTVLSRRHKNLDFMIREKKMSKDQTFIMNWQFVFYMLQGIYLCSLFMQMMSEKETASNKTRYLNCWPLSSRHLVKMD